MEFHNAFRVFRSYNYRLFFTGQLISRIGMWMQRTAVIWIIYTMTDSVLMVGLATFAEQFPSFLLSPVGGITADRYNRYRVLMVTQVTSALQAVALTVAYHMGYHSLELLLSLSLVLGIANAFDIPARQAMVNEIVEDKKDLPSAIAMNSSVNNLTRLIGPALAGIVLAKYGATICFFSNAVSFIAVIVCLTLMKYSHRSPDRIKKNVWAEFREGWQYTKKAVRDPADVVAGSFSESVGLYLQYVATPLCQKYFQWRCLYVWLHYRRYGYGSISEYTVYCFPTEQQAVEKNTAP